MLLVILGTLLAISAIAPFLGADSRRRELMPRKYRIIDPDRCLPTGRGH
jgi:hypothetical protein